MIIRNIFNCISIHNGGGIVYLSMMHSEIDKKGNLVFLDYRAKNDLLPFINAETIYFRKNIFRNLKVFKERLKYSLIFRRYLKKTNKIESLNEFYLNGIPPLYRFPLASNKVLILFQNRNLFSYLNYMSNKLNFSFKFTLYHILHSLLINIFLKKTDIIMVQTKSMYKSISKLKPLNKIIIKDLFWRNLTLDKYIDTIKKVDVCIESKLIHEIKRISKLNKVFFYPASFSPHKNHKLLLKCFNKLFENNIYNIKLLLTVDFKDLKDFSSNKEHIVCIGSQTPQMVYEIYKLVDFLIFPSLNESLGLPLIEASLHGIPIIASDLEYVYDVCNPTFTFNPYSEDEIYNKILKSIKYNS